MKGDEKIWYLLKCPEGDEDCYTKKCLEFIILGEPKEIVCFQYQRLLRYGGEWHMERRMLLPGYIFLSVSKTVSLKRDYRKNGKLERGVSLIPCEIPYLRHMCQEGNLIGMSRGVIRDGNPVVINGPLKGRENLIQRIDRHKRIAEIEIPFNSRKKRVIVGLEIYEKQA